jgi:hypothetical protein
LAHFVYLNWRGGEGGEGLGKRKGLKLPATMEAKELAKETYCGGKRDLL